MKPIRVLLADDHDLVRAGIRALLKGLAGIEVVAEAGNGREALALVEVHRPDVVLMDIMMPELNGLDATAQLAARSPEVRVVVLSMNAGEEYVLQALRAGAAAIAAGERDPQAVRELVAGIIEAEPLAELDYVEVVDADSLATPETLQGNLRLLAAVRFGRARLIDNVGVTV